MTPKIFNICLLLGWLLIVAGVAGLHSLALAAVVGGVLVLGLTVFLALRVGVRPPAKPVPNKEAADVSQ